MIIQRTTSGGVFIWCPKMQAHSKMFYKKLHFKSAKDLMIKHRKNLSISAKRGSSVKKHN